jgi:cadmium resistance protein CadD (predicted permease)
VTHNLALVIWGLVGAVFVGVVIASIVSDRVPSLADVLALLTRTMVGVVLVMLGWLWLGWHLFVRR